MTDKKPVLGGCCCGRVQYRSTKPAYGMTFCYCSTCRLLHGAPFAPWTNLQRQSFQWIRDEDVVEAKFSDFATRTFCRVCHAPITMVYEAAPDEVGIVATTIDEAKSGGAIPRVERHIYVRDRPSWYTISESGVRYEGLPEDMKEYVKT